MHHADPFGVYQIHRVAMLHGCSPGELLTRTAFMHHDDQGQRSLEHSAAVTRLSSGQYGSRGNIQTPILPEVAHFLPEHFQPILQEQHCLQIVQLKLRFESMVKVDVI